MGMMDMMECPNCKRRMYLLLISYGCDHCEGPGPVDCYSGFIVFQPSRVGAGSVFHVFRRPIDAALWRSAVGLQHCELREVLSEDPIVWYRSRGSIENIELANTPFEIFGDHRFEPGASRAFIAPHYSSAAA